MTPLKAKKPDDTRRTSASVVPKPDKIKRLTLDLSEGLHRAIKKNAAEEAVTMVMNPEICRNIYDAIDDPVFLHDAKYRVLLANRAYCSEAGVSEAEALGKPYWEVFPRGAGPLPGCRAALETGHDGEREEVKAGEKLFLFEGYPVRDDQGKLLYSLHILVDITAQRQAEAALRQSEAQLRAATKCARDAIITLDGESGAVTAWNPAAEAVFGYNEEEMIGRMLHEIITPPRFREAAMKGMAHFAATGEGAAVGKTLELVALHKNGMEFPIELSLSAMQIDGKWYANGIARDITARKRAEASLKNMAARYQTIFDASSDAIMLFDGQAFTDCNPATLRIFGCSSRDDFIHKHLALFSPATQPGGEDSMSLVNEHIAAVFKNGSHRFEWMHCRLDGTEFPAEVLLTAMELEGKPVVQATVRDISERMKADASEKRYRRLFESAKDGILILDAETGRIVDANPFISDLLGYTQETCLGKSIWDIGPLKNIVASKEKFLELQQQGYVRYEDLPLETRQGGTIHVEFVSNVYLVGTTKVIQCNIRDISRRKLAEDKNHRLGQMYRTISQCNEVLVRAPDELSLADEMCRVLVEKGGFRAAWVGYADPGADKRIHPVAAVGIEQGEIEAMNLSWEDSEHGQGPTGIAVRTGQIMVSRDILNDALWRQWHDQARRLGLAAATAIPLQMDGKTFGVIDIYGADADAFAPDMQALLAELAGDLAFGIGNLRARAERLGILEKLEHSLDHAVTAIAATVEMRDPYTAGHQRRVAHLAVAIAKEMGLDADRLEGLRMAGVVHDIGKIHVPAEILSNPAKLSDAEFEIIKTHSRAGWEILKGIDFPWPVAEIVYQHHEKLDGSGYPRGLKGEEILLEARILTVADVIESMASHRPYRPGFGIFPALQEISRNKGKLFDAAVVEACMRVFMERNYEL